MIGLYSVCIRNVDPFEERVGGERVHVQSSIVPCATEEEDDGGIPRGNDGCGYHWANGREIKDLGYCIE